MDKFIASDFMSLTVERKDGIKMDHVTWTMTSDHDYLVTTTYKKGADVMFLKFTLYFGANINPRITIMETIRNPLKCKISNGDYISEQQCLVSHFFDKDFSPCPVKCIPIQMRGFRYVNSSSELTNCNKLEDEICNGGPIVWKELKKHFKRCKKPCSISSYDHSMLEKMDMLYITDEKNEATFAFFNSDVVQVEKEVLLYDLSDLIGTVGGSCGIGVGISVFAVISCCIDSFLKLLNMFRRKQEDRKLLGPKCSKIPIYTGRINTKPPVINNPY